MRTGHLFAGIDGIGLGLEPHGFETAWFSEYEAAPSRVLAHHYPGVPNHGDITAIDWSKVEPVDVLTGGYPCQPFSYAGSRGGDNDARHLWPFYRDAIRHLRPRLALLENVPGHRSLGFGRVLGDLAEAGYDCWWTSLRASDVGAAHRRERVFIVATTADPGRIGQERRIKRTSDAQPDGLTEQSGLGLYSHDLAPDAVGLRRQRRGEHGDVASTSGAGEGDCEQRQPYGDAVDDRGFVDWGEFELSIRRWERAIGRPAPAPTVGGRLSPEFVTWHMGFPAGWVDMIPRTQALKALGNAVVPQCADVIGRWALDLVEAREVAA